MNQLVSREEGGPTRRLPGPSRREVIEGLAAELEAGGIEGARGEAERMLSHALGLSRTELLLHSDAGIGPDEAGRIAAISRRRLSGVPLQHIEGSVAFRELELVCDGRALVPRPETEQLVQRVADWTQRAESAAGVRRVRREDPDAEPAIDIALDIGTGSGAIALSLVHEGIARRVVALDVSQDALEQAKCNATRAGLGNRVEFRKVQSSPWDAVGPGETFDLIVSNPPYVTDSEVRALPAEVREHDPREALAAGPDGLDIIRQIVAEAHSHVRSGGALFLEIGESQGERVRQLLEDSASWKTVHVARDLAGRERFVVAQA